MTSLKNNTKILFTDLDGTLFDDQKQICPENRSAIRRALLAGHKIVITTGRPLFSAKKLCEQLLSLMESYGFMEQREHTCLFFPVVAKRSAAYREEEA